MPTQPAVQGTSGAAEKVASGKRLAAVYLKVRGEVAEWLKAAVC
jgi:hypothetical protein